MQDEVVLNAWHLPSYMVLCGVCQSSFYHHWSCRYLLKGHYNQMETVRRENPHGQRSLTATVHRVSKSWTWLKRLSMHAQSAFRLLASKTVRGCISIVLKALSLQRFVTAAIDSEYAQPHPAPDSCLHILHTCPAAWICHGLAVSFAMMGSSRLSGWAVMRKPWTDLEVWRGPELEIQFIPFLWWAEDLTFPRKSWIPVRKILIAVLLYVIEDLLYVQVCFKYIN